MDGRFEEWEEWMFQVELSNTVLVCMATVLLYDPIVYHISPLPQGVQAQF